MGQGSGLTYFNAKALFQPIIVIPFSDVKAPYAIAGTTSGNGCILYITSTLNVACYLSFDGINEHIYVLNGGEFSVQYYNLKANGMVLPANSIIYVKDAGTGAGSGELGITVVGI
jgi:hypothetical protein